MPSFWFAVVIFAGAAIGMLSGFAYGDPGVGASMGASLGTGAAILLYAWRRRSGRPGEPPHAPR